MSLQNFRHIKTEEDTGDTNHILRELELCTKLQNIETLSTIRTICQIIKVINYSVLCENVTFHKNRDIWLFFGNYIVLHIEDYFGTFLGFLLHNNRAASRNK